MKTRFAIVLILLIAGVSQLKTQSKLHPWKMIGSGGGRSTSGGSILQGSLGQPAVLKGTSGALVLEGGYVPGVRVLSGSSSILNVQTEEGWNMLSVPLIVADYHKSVLYASAISNAFVFKGSYMVQSELQNTLGFWIKFSAAEPITYAGMSFAMDTVDVQANWNMIGGTSYRLAKSNIIPVGTSLTSEFFTYSSSHGYDISDTLAPGLGYWIRVSSAGKLILGGSPAAAVRASLDRPPVSSHSEAAADLLRGDRRGRLGLREVDKLLLEDALKKTRTLYFTVRPLGKGDETDYTPFELPPPPPDGLFDARYRSGTSLVVADPVDEKEFSIRLASAAYPVSIQWKDVSPDVGGAWIVVGTRATRVSGSGEVRLPAEGVPVKLRLAPAPMNVLPKEFALQQNYPNPFNPVTDIRYALPVDSRVSLRVYDVLGQEVATLVDGIQEAGYQQASWSATNVHGNPIASGVYFYRIEASGVSNPQQTFTQVRKMMIMK